MIEKTLAPAGSASGSGAAGASGVEEAACRRVERQAGGEAAVELLLPDLGEPGALEALGELGAVGLATDVPPVRLAGGLGPAVRRSVVMTVVVARCTQQAKSRGTEGGW